MEYKVKIGDKLIPNNSCDWFIEGEVVKITPYNTSIKTANTPSDLIYGVTIRAEIKDYNILGQKITRTRNIETCNLKINPENPDINIDWTHYQTYCKAIFFTSKKEKEDFYKRQKEYKKIYHLNMAKIV